MTKSIKWKRIRILVTGKCNYRCPFCHNEGQEKSSPFGDMNYEDFKKVIDFLKNQHIIELAISGGEPFVNPKAVEMIEYACMHLDCDVSCATNLSLITNNDIERLSKTRVKFNIQFPFIDEYRFKQSTGNGNLLKILDTIHKVRTAGIQIGLNIVIQSTDADSIKSLIEFSIQEELPLKLLPQIGGNGSEKYRDWVFPMLRNYAISENDKGTGAIRWIVAKDNHKTSVLYIDSPCFSKDIDTCRAFGELRVHPGLQVQSCISKPLSDKLDFVKGNEYIANQLRYLWNDFITC